MTENDSTRRLTVRVDGEDWEEARSLSEAAADDRVFVVDEATGGVVFGDGTHGRRPADGVVVTISYRDGEGAEGNTEVSVTARWPPAHSLYIVALSSAGIRVGAIGDGGECIDGA